MNAIIRSQQVLVAISDALRFTSVYTASTGNVEVERLYWIGTTTMHDFVKKLPVEAFTRSQAINQHDTFFDWQHGDHWLLSATDQYIRLREQHSAEGEFMSGEVKRAFPGPAWNPNARPASDCKLTEEELTTWRVILASIGLKPEREYIKQRVSCTSQQDFHELPVELEIDHFAVKPFNGSLQGNTFVSVSCEVPGSLQAQAELALQDVLVILNELSIPFVVCKGNYEDLFYGRIPFPSIKSPTL